MQNINKKWPSDMELAEAGRKFGTPAFIFSPQQFVENIHALKHAFDKAYPRFELCYAAKTNFLPDVLSTASSAGAHIEVVAGLELDLIEHMGLLNKDTVVNGPMKTESDILQAGKAGARINVDSWSEFETINSLGKKLGQRIPCGIRVKRECHYDKWARFGFNIENGVAQNILENVRTRLPYVAMRGIHFHMGTNNNDLEFFRESSSVIAEWATQVTGKGLITLDYLDMGGGLASDCPPVDKKNGWSNPTNEQYATAICLPILEAFPQNPPALIIEPGRRLVDDSFVFLTSVAGFKDLDRDAFVVDGSINMFPSVQAPHRAHKMTAALRDGSGAPKDFQVYGCSPMDMDFWGTQNLPSNIKEGDILVVQSAGAYSINLERTFTRYLPKILKWTGSDILPIRREQNLSDYLQTQSSPAGESLMIGQSPKEGTKRYFIASPIPSGTFNGMIQVCEAQGLHLDWVAPENAHITLSYIGATSEHEVKSIEQRLRQISYQPFDITSARFSSFLSGTTGQSIISAHIAAESALTDLQARISDATASTAEHSESLAFMPHLTLARASAELAAQLQQQLEAIPSSNQQHTWSLDKFCLYEATGGDNGEPVKYWSLAEFPIECQPSAESASIGKDNEVSPATKRTMIEYAHSLLKSQPKIEAAWMIGSYGRGDNDQYSDFDFCAFVRSPKDVDDTFGNIKLAIANDTNIVFFKVLPFGRTLNAITDDWERIDITIVDENRIGAMPLNEAKFLFGQEKAEPLMRKYAPVDHTAEKEDTQTTINEFIRVLGLLPVAVGRNDFVLGQTGAQLLREMLVKLMIRENPENTARGVLSTRKSLSDQQYAVLKNIPPIAADKDALMAVYKYLASEFFVRGQRLTEAQGLTWPTRFVDATKRSLQSKVGINL